MEVNFDGLQCKILTRRINSSPAKTGLNEENRMNIIGTSSIDYVLSFGGGVDSTALLAIDLDRDRSADLIGISREELDQKFPSPSHYVFADTGAESDATYRNVHRAGQRLGGRLNIVRKDGENILEWCLRLGSVPVMPGGSHVCSLKYKGEVMAKWAAENGLSPTWIIGIEANEERRAKRFSAPKGDLAGYIYPLIDLGLTRDRCVEILVALGWSGVEKSSCVFCPFKSEEELRDMYFGDRKAWADCEAVEARFEKASAEKHQAWVDASRPLNKRGHAPRGMWRKNSFAEGARLFVKRVDGRQLSVAEWGAKFEAECGLREVLTA